MINNKDKYIEYCKNNFTGNSLDLLIEVINLFYSDISINKNKYNVGDYVYLKQGTYMHGIPGLLDNFDWVINNGFIGNDFTGSSNGKNKIKNSIGMWVIKNDCYLKDYINNYSGFTITYNIGRGPDSKRVSELVPYHKFDEVTERINNESNIWSYSGEQTKEVRFLPSLVSNKRQIAFILNMDNDGSKFIKYDLWNIKEMDFSIFTDYRYTDQFMIDRENRNCLTTDRESAIMFGLPSSLIEGVLVGRDIENDLDSLNYIKSKLRDCYICNLDGKVIL